MGIGAHGRAPLLFRPILVVPGKTRTAVRVLGDHLAPFPWGEQGEGAALLMLSLFLATAILPIGN